MQSKKIWASIALSALLLTACTKQESGGIQYPVGVTTPKLDQYELDVISEKIYQNETSGNPKNIMFWSKN